MSLKKVKIIYDKDCPACRFYTQFTRVKDNFDLELINARDKHFLVQEVQKKDINLDEGFVVMIDKTLYHGAEAIHNLALISSKSDIFNKFTYWVFKSKSRSKVLYPILKTGRNVLLKILRIKKIKTN